MHLKPLKFPEIRACGQETAFINEAFICLSRDSLQCRFGYPFGAWFLCENTRLVAVANHPNFLGCALGGGVIALNLSHPLMKNPWFAGSVALHEAAHQDWAKRHGTTRNSQTEERDCLFEQLRFLERNGQDASFVRWQIQQLQMQWSC